MEEEKVDNGVKADIDAMLDSMAEPAEPGPAPEPVIEPVVEPTPEPVKPAIEPVIKIVEPEPVVEPPAEPVPAAEPPVEPTEEPPAGPPAEPAEPVEPTPETPEGRMARIEEQNRLLMERVEFLSTPAEFRTAPPPTAEPEEPAVAPVLDPAAAQPASIQPVVQPAAVQPVQPAVVEPLDFIKGRPLTEVIDNPETLNALLNEVANQAGTKNVDVVVEKILTSIPNIVASQIVQQNTVNNMVNDFYVKNEDLKGVKRTVAAFANEVHSEEPGLQANEVFEKAGGRARKVLGLRERATNPARKPAFVRQRGSRKGGEVELTGLAKDIDEMIE